MGVSLGTFFLPSLYRIVWAFYLLFSLFTMDDCQHILKALGAFDYVAATKLISKITKVTPSHSFFVKALVLFNLKIFRRINLSVISLLDYVVVKARSHSYSF